MSAALVLTLASLLAGATVGEQIFETLYEWNLLSYDLPANGYVPQNNLFTGLEVYWDRIFLALPNLRSGVPATLTWLPRPDSPQASYIDKSPALQPYPGWEWQGTAGNCTGLVSVYRIRVDRCNRLWVLDSGVITTLDNFSPVCPPKIFVFDLKTDTLVRNIILPREVLRPNSLLTNLVIDYEITGTGAGPTLGAGNFYGFHQQPQQTCDDAFLYMTDTANAGIVVYDIKNDAAWRVFHPYMLPHPEHCTYNIAGESFTLPDAVVGIALSPETAPIFGYPTQRQERVLYFQPFAALRLFSIPTSVLQTPPQIDADLRVRLVFEKSSQSASLASDPTDGTLYFNPVSDLAIASLRPGNRRAQVVVQDQQRIQFSSDILITPRDNYNIWFVTSKFQKFFRQTYDPNVINFRVMRIVRTPYNLDPHQALK
ncbi:dopaminechrome tautomerase [Periplaneta americana]|uniref:dopaminechrome tautomerase n=1 Tax=Periplaneta americana TaxID=6978 RepID=UPI0037E7A3BF